MRKGIFSFLLLAAVAVTGCSTKSINVIEHPSVDFYTTESLDINRIELTDSTTVLHFSAVYIPGFWIRLDKGTHIVAGDGKLPCIGSDRLTLGEKFYIPESGRDTFSLTFPAVPKGTESIDFSEERTGDAFRMFGIDLTGHRKPVSLAAVPAEYLRTPDREEGLPPVRLEGGTTHVNIHLLGYHKGIGRTARLYVNDIKDGQRRVDVQIDTLTGTASASFELSGPAEMVLTNPVYVDFMAVAGEDVEIFIDLTAHSYDVRKKHSPEAVQGIAPRPSAYFGGCYSALNYYLNNESRDDLPFAPFLAGEGIDCRWSDEEYAGNVIARYRAFADSLATVPAARSVKEYYAGGLKNALVCAFANAVEMRRDSFENENAAGAPVPVFRPLAPACFARLAEVVDLNDSTLLACMDALPFVQAKSIITERVSSSR